MLSILSPYSEAILEVNISPLVTSCWEPSKMLNTLYFTYVKHTSHTLWQYWNSTLHL